MKLGSYSLTVATFQLNYKAAEEQICICTTSGVRREKKTCQVDYSNNGSNSIKNRIKGKF